MRKVEAEKVTDIVAELCIKANCNLRKDVEEALVKALKTEKNPSGKEVLKIFLKNAYLSRRQKTPICQDTGYVNVFLELGQEVEITGGSLFDAINEGVRRGYVKTSLRSSVVDDPLYERKNTLDNTPAVIHTEIVEGERLKIIVMPRGGGSENASALYMLSPLEGARKVKKLVVERIKEVGFEACPPLIIGIGIGGSFDSVSYLGKKALLREVGKHHREKQIARLEKELLNEINLLDIGPAGLGGSTTALGVSIETRPSHMATLPVAVNISCHALRSSEVVL